LEEIMKKIYSITLMILVFLSITALSQAQQQYQAKDSKPKKEIFFQINSYVLQSINVTTGQFRVLDVLTNEIKTFNTHSFMGSMFVRQVKTDRVVFDAFEWVLKESDKKDAPVEEEEEIEEETDEDDEFGTVEDILFEDEEPAEEPEDEEEEKK
jgi:hypothetical protein